MMGHDAYWLSFAVNANCPKSKGSGQFLNSVW